MNKQLTSKSSECERMRWCEYLSGQILLYIVSGDEDPAFEAPTLQLQVLSLSPQQVGLLLCLGMDIKSSCCSHTPTRLILNQKYFSNPRRSLTGVFLPS